MKYLVLAAALVVEAMLALVIYGVGFVDGVSDCRRIATATAGIRG